MKDYFLLIRINVFCFFCTKFRKTLFNRELLIVRKGDEIELLKKMFGIIVNDEQISAMQECHDFVEIFGYNVSNIIKTKKAFLTNCSKVKNKKDFKKLKVGSLIMFVRTYENGEIEVFHSAIKLNDGYLIQMNAGKARSLGIHYVKPFSALSYVRRGYLYKDRVIKIDIFCLRKQKQLDLDYII